MSMSKLNKTIFWSFRMRQVMTMMTVLILFSNCSTYKHKSTRFTADNSEGPRSAFEIYSQLQESATSFNTKAVLVDGETIDGLRGGVTWGGEKEASSSLLTRIMTPDTNSMESYVRNLDDSSRKTFLADFLGKYVKNSNGYRTYRTEEGVVLDLARDVVDVDGNPQTIDLSGLRGINFNRASLSVLEEKFEYWIEQTGDRPLTFVKPTTRMKMFKGKLPGQTEGEGIKRISYGNWVAQFGPAEKHVDAAHGHGGGLGGGWEINFKPMETYGEFEEQVSWFRKSLKNAGKLFQAPGHQRMVFRKHPDLDRGALSEMYRAIQALIVVDGIRGKTGIETASYKDVQTDSTLKSLSSSRGVIRLEGERFALNTMAIEFRAGTKDLRLARFYQTALASRVASNDWQGMADIDQYKLFDGYGGESEDLVRRFGVSEEIAEKALENMSVINDEFRLPFWHWESEGIPFLSREKKKLISGMTKGLIEQMAALNGNQNTIDANAKNIMREWVRATNLSEELHHYLRPKRSAAMTEDLLYFNPDGRRLRIGIGSLVEGMLNRGGIDGIDEDIERKVLEFSLNNPNLGGTRILRALSVLGTNVTPSQITKILSTHGMNNATLRLAKVGQITSLSQGIEGIGQINGVSEDLERKVLHFSLNNPSFGTTRVVRALNVINVGVTPGDINKVFSAHNMGSSALRLAKSQSIVSGTSGGSVDVNAIDLGIEYSGRMPLRVRADFTPDRLADNKKAWLTTFSDFTQDERVNFIKKVATDLKDELGGNGEASRVEQGSHGHGLDISWEIRDSENRKWIVEWDGVGRSYTDAGEVIPDSLRAGSIELVTPKFTPRAEEMSTVFDVFQKNNVLPRLRSGGGHINIDLAAFAGKPKQLARFMSIFHEHRGVIALMFQRINRIRNAEAINISDHLRNQLRDFNGSEEDLKKLLYNERYFNTRYGRKSRYIQLDLSAYFQDVIPEEFITEDFDIGNPNENWRRQFRVDSNIRKAEFRMFNAPRDPAESALQIRLVRAMLHKALNEDDELSGVVQKVHLEGYLQDPAKAYDDLDKMMRDLKLSDADFRPAVAEGLSETDINTRSIFYETLEEKLRLFPHQAAWGEAVEARPNPIESEGRQWVSGPADSQNTMTNAHRISAAREAMRQRALIVPNRSNSGNFRRTDSCIDAISPFL